MQMSETYEKLSHSQVQRERYNPKSANPISDFHTGVSRRQKKLNMNEWNKQQSIPMPGEKPEKSTVTGYDSNCDFNAVECQSRYDHAPQWKFEEHGEERWYASKQSARVIKKKDTKMDLQDLKVEGSGKGYGKGSMSGPCAQGSEHSKAGRLWSRPRHRAGKKGPKNEAPDSY